MKVIPLEVGNLQLLKELEIWEVGIGLLKALETLDVSEIELEAWPPQVDQLHALTRLNISKNKLPIMPSSVASLTHLGIIDASYNLFLSFPLDLLFVPLKVCCGIDVECVVFYV